MADYRRWHVAGGTTFFTLVTYGRRPLFSSKSACRLLGTVMRVVRSELPFKTVAVVLLPDHLHAIWSLPFGDADYSTRWKKIKIEFSTRWLAAGGSEAMVTPSQMKRGSRGIWQRRFYEHQVRDENELEALCDYVHYNPVKHGHAASPWHWPRSTFRRFVAAGQYSKDWGHSQPPSITALDYE